MRKKLNEKWKKKNARYKEICLPLSSVIQTGGSYAITIPKKICSKYRIKKGDKVIPTLLVRTLKLSDELNNDELIDLATEISQLKFREQLIKEEEQEIDKALKILRANKEKTKP